jgi:hypothetical protein
VVPAWVLYYTVILVLGLIAGLQLRFLIALIVLVVAVIGVIWLLGYIDTSLLVNLPTLTGKYLAGLPIGPQVLVTVAGAVFLVGVLISLLLTTRLRAFDRAHAS